MLDSQIPIILHGVKKLKKLRHIWHDTLKFIAENVIIHRPNSTPSNPFIIPENVSIDYCTNTAQKLPKNHLKGCINDKI